MDMIPGTTPVLDLASADAALAEFDLQVTVTTDAAVGYTVRRCDTSDTCAATCASSCASS
jgi:FxLD family lantipeptide